MGEREPWFPELLLLISSALQPFIVPDVKPTGASHSETFHALRDLVDEGVLRHSQDGYRGTPLWPSFIADRSA